MIIRAPQELVCYSPLEKKTTPRNVVFFLRISTRRSSTACDTRMPTIHGSCEVQNTSTKDQWLLPRV
jgi:hypothetical protein